MIPTEAIGSLPRSTVLQKAMQDFASGVISDQAFEDVLDEAIAETTALYEETESPVLTDGEQSKSSFVTYPLEGLDNLASEGVVIPFADGHKRQLPRLVSGPFRYGKFAGSYLDRAKKHTSKPLKQGVISASALSLLYPSEKIAGYSREQFMDDLVANAIADIQSCFDQGACKVQIDFTEARLAIKLDPSKALLQQFIELNNRVLESFSLEDRQKMGVHACPGADHNSTHSGDVPYHELIPLLMSLNVGNFYLQMATESQAETALRSVADNLKNHHRIFVGVIDVNTNEVESDEMVRDRVLAAAKYIPLAQLGTTDDCGFSPFADDIATSRATAFAKIAARVRGTRMAEKMLGIA